MIRVVLENLVKRFDEVAVVDGASMEIRPGELSFVLGPIGPGPYLEVLSQLGTHEAEAGFGIVGALMNAGLAPTEAQAWWRLTVSIRSSVVRPWA